MAYLVRTCIVSDEMICISLPSKSNAFWISLSLYLYYNNLMSQETDNYLKHLLVQQLKLLWQTDWDQKEVFFRIDWRFHLPIPVKVALIIKIHPVTVLGYLPLSWRSLTWFYFYHNRETVDCLQHAHTWQGCCFYNAGTTKNDVLYKKKD